MTSTEEKRLGYSTISIVAALVFFFSLWLLDFPKPFYDDLFYTGAALNMTAGGDFSNPLLARQGIAGSKSDEIKTSPHLGRSKPPETDQGDLYF